VQKCGNEPHELALRFAGCNLRCGPCFASGYSWPELFRKNRRVVGNISSSGAIEEYKKIPYPANYSKYNWLRILGGEPFLNDNYAQFLFDVIFGISEIDSKKFNNGIIIQTNGVYLGGGNVEILKRKLQELYRINPSVKVAIEISIKGTNLEEFKLITQTDNADFFRFNLKSYYNLMQLTPDLPNLRPMIIAGFGINESYLLNEGGSNDRITIIFKDDKPIYHPDFWSEEFRKLYDDFTTTYKTLDPMFRRMPMYGIKDQFSYAWVKPTIKQGKEVYGNKWYDRKYMDERGGRNISLENSFADILKKFFLVNNQKYYSTMVK